MSTTIKQAINGFLLSCKVEGKSYGTIECYSDKLKGFLWYATDYDWPDDVSAITTNHPREFLAYLRETPHRFKSTCPRAMKPSRLSFFRVQKAVVLGLSPSGASLTLLALGNAALPKANLRLYMLYLCI